MAYSEITNKVSNKSTVEAGYNYVFDVLRFNKDIASLDTNDIVVILSTSYALLRGSIKDTQLRTAINRSKKELA